MLSHAWSLLISKIDHGVDPTLLQEINKEINYPHRPHALHSYLILLENTPSAQVRERLRHWFFNRYYQISFSTGTIKSRPLGSVQDTGYITRTARQRVISTDHRAGCLSAAATGSKCVTHRRKNAHNCEDSNPQPQASRVASFAIRAMHNM